MDRSRSTYEGEIVRSRDIGNIQQSGTRMRGRREQKGNIPDQGQTGVDGNGVRTQF